MTPKVLNPAPQREAIALRNPSQVVEEPASSIADFTQVVTHRIGGLLSGIEGFTDLLVPELDKEEHRDHAFRILESVSRIEGILHDLNHYEDAPVVRKHRIRATSIASDTLNLINDVDLERVKPDIRLDRNVFVLADERLIRQALLSVLKNAFDATLNDLTPVSFSLDAMDGQRVRFRVFNVGAIENPEVRRRLFDPFFTTKAHNLGLGLTMARRIFRLHDGDVRLSSEAIAAGTEISLTLPVAGK